MDIIAFQPKVETKQEGKLYKPCIKFKELLSELRKKELDADLIKRVYREIEYLNTISESSKLLKSQIKKKQSTIIKLVEKEAKLVVKNHYRNLWLAIGMAAFGIPLGLAFGNMAFLGIGLPIGFAMGIAIGSNMDKKAKEEDRQLDFEME
jgi:hypothetical protein